MARSAAEREAAVRAAFAAQAVWCRRLGSPFTGQLCETVGRFIDRSELLGRRILDWPGEPDALHDSVPLRLCGGLHALVRAGRLPSLVPVYPPHPLPAAEEFWPVLRDAMAEAGAELLTWLEGAPQTNEVARSAVLMAGLAVAAAETGCRLALYELGASAGLNLLCDRYDIELGGRRYGTATSALRLAPDWEGPPPPEVAIGVSSRQGVDVSPLDVTDPRDRERLLAYIWADQAERLARLEAAIDIARRQAPSLDKGDAADWIERRIAPECEPGTARVVLHSIAFQYFPPATQARIAAHLTAIGASATGRAPLAWLRYELEPEAGSPTLRLRLWPDGTDRLLAKADAHGRKVSWLG